MITALAGQQAANARKIVRRLRLITAALMKCAAIITARPMIFPMTLFAPVRAAWFVLASAISANVYLFAVMVSPVPELTTPAAMPLMLTATV